jgi:DNA repair exonuclease SbcCD ATPase subunit
VRIALGNTGSKTTIHKMLRQLDEEDAVVVPDISVALQALVAQLAEQLRAEAEATLQSGQSRLAELEAEQAKRIAAFRTEADAAARACQTLQCELDQERRARSNTAEVLQAESIARHTAEQQVRDLLERLAENEQHRTSLEDKHRHAREALEHFRQAAKDQREREERRHEAEVQQLRSELYAARQEAIGKQEEASRLNLDAARLVAELAAVQRALFAEQQSARSLEIKLDQMSSYERQCLALTAQLEERKEWQSRLEEQLERTKQDAESMRTTVAAAQQELARSRGARSAAKGGKQRK